MSVRIMTAFIIGLLALCSCTQKTDQPGPVKSDYDSTHARKLGADDYGMKKYWLAYLKRGPVRSQDSVTAKKLQRAHLANIMRLAKEGKLVMAGPFLDDGEVRGLYIFDVANRDSAEALAKSDPSVQAGRLVLEFHPWYASAAIKDLAELHKRIAKKNP